MDCLGRFSMKRRFTKFKGHRNTIRIFLLEIMDELVDDQVKRFKFHLNTLAMEDFDPIPSSQLEHADRMDVIKKMKDQYGTEGALKVSYTILKKMDMNSLAKKLKNVMKLDQSPPNKVDITSLGTNSVTVKWDKPKHLDGVPHSYHVTWTDHNKSNQSIITDDNELVISKLSPGMEYNVSVCTVLRDTNLKSDPVDIKICTKQEMRIVLLGRTGVGKSATGNSILGKKEFKSQLSNYSVTVSCAVGKATVDGRKVTVVDTPGLFNTKLSNEDVVKKMVECMSVCAPGPHAFLVVLQVGRFTQEEQDTVDIIQETLGPQAAQYTMVLFTHGDHLGGTADKFLQGDKRLTDFINRCQGQHHVFNNKDVWNSNQVIELLDKIDEMVRKNAGGCYTNKMLKEAEKAAKNKGTGGGKDEEKKSSLKGGKENKRTGGEKDEEKKSSLKGSTENKGTGGEKDEEKTSSLKGGKESKRTGGETGKEGKKCEKEKAEGNGGRAGGVKKSINGEEAAVGKDVGMSCQ